MPSRQLSHTTDRHMYNESKIYEPSKPQLYQFINSVIGKES